MAREPLSRTWYVTFEVQKRGTLPKARHPRLTETFVTEAEAKACAREKLDQGLVVTAGTLINPYSPKQIIPASSISSWLDGEEIQGGQGINESND